MNRPGVIAGDPQWPAFAHAYGSLPRDAYLLCLGAATGHELIYLAEPLPNGNSQPGNPQSLLMRRQASWFLSYILSERG